MGRPHADERSRSTSETTLHLYLNLGTALLSIGEREEGLAQYRIVLRDEMWASIPPALAAALGSGGQTPGAVRRSLEDWVRRTQPGLAP